MGKILTYEQMMALFAEGRKETTELRAELRTSISELRASISEQQVSISNLQSIVEKNNAMMEKNNATMEKNNATMEKNNATMEKNNATMEKNNATMEKNNATMEINNHRIGILTNKLGVIVEDIVVPGIVDKFNEKGFGFDSVSTNVEFLNEKKDGNLAEIDALLENGKFVIAVETKTELQISDVNKHVKRLKILREMPRFKGKKIYGALATAVSKRKPVNYALEQGFYVLQRPDTMGLKILDFPKGCRAKAW